MTISRVTRRDIFDELQKREVEYSGRLDEIEFLSRLYDLTEMESDDERFDSAKEDILQHRYNNDDWDDDWVYEDDRFELLNGDDETLLAFLCEMVHPEVRSRTEAEELVELFNRLLASDGWELYPVKRISGRPVYGARLGRGTAAASPPPHDFDTIIVYNDKDWNEVKAVVQMLVDRNLSPWVDKRHLRPGLNFQEELERLIEHIRTACVFVGVSGTGPWQRAEIRAILNEFTKRNLPVIPVLLPSAPGEPKLPLLLRMFSWVRFHKSLNDAEAFAQLVYGITGRRAEGPDVATTVQTAARKRKAAAIRRAAAYLAGQATPGAGAAYHTQQPGGAQTRVHVDGTTIGTCQVRLAGCTALPSSQTPVAHIVHVEPDSAQVNVCRHCLDQKLSSGEWLRVPD